MDDISISMKDEEDSLTNSPENKRARGDSNPRSTA